VWPRRHALGDVGGAAAESYDVIVVEVALYELARMPALDPAVVRQRYRRLGWITGADAGTTGARSGCSDIHRQGDSTFFFMDIGDMDDALASAANDHNPLDLSFSAVSSPEYVGADKCCGFFSAFFI
jgi:hypothetical protein